jgi:hypothetical protein
MDNEAKSNTEIPKINPQNVDADIPLREDDFAMLS